MGKTFKRNNTENGFRKFRNDTNFKKSKKFKHIHDEFGQEHPKRELTDEERYIENHK